MEGNVRQARRGRQSVEPLADRVGMWRPAVVVGEQVVAGVIGVPKEFTFAVLELAPTAQRRHGGAVDRNRLVSVPGLPAGLVERLAADHHAIVVHGDHAGVEIDIGPLQTAHLAAPKGQFAAEVVCLKTAAQFGDHSGASRLRDLEAILEGPRVGVAARFSAARSDGGAAQLAAVSEEFERMGDLVAAVDAAAQAALTYRRQGLRGSALGCSARAAALAEQCGANTPALRQASEPLPLTDREREIVMLIGEGLSNRVVAERLTLSVRTVESHIYRAMLKTGTTSRDELAALIPGHGTRTQ